jgi:phosphosulfolactate phosphohydrolase-like enzyme
MFLALTLVGCSANRIAFNHAPTLIYYWLDAYFDFDGPQSLAFKTSLNELQAWHRKEELPQLAELLKNLQPVASQEVSADQVCTLWTFMQQRLQAPVNHLAPALAQLASSLKPAQMEHIAAEFKKRNQNWREEWLDRSPAERLARRSQQIVDRSEQFYGRLNDAQREKIRAQLAASGYDPEMLQKEMLRRQQDSLLTLSHVRNKPSPPDEAQAELLALFARATVSPDAASRQYSEAVTQSGCAAVAAVHNSSTAEQKAKLLKTLQAYEADARTLMQAP